MLFHAATVLYFAMEKFREKNKWQTISIQAGSNCAIFTNQYPDSYDIRVATICQDGKYYAI
jgi:hypothetical protein